MIDTRTEHPLTTAIRAAITDLAGFTDTPLYGLRPDEQLLDQQCLAALENRVHELQLRLARQAALDDADAKTAWVRGTHQAPRVADLRLKLAAALEDREPVRAAMAAGEVSEAQARVVVKALEDLPADLDPDLAERAEQHLLDLCGDHHPDDLCRLGRKLLEVLAPDIAEAHEARLVEDEYRRGLEKCRLTLADRHDGTWSLHGLLPAMHGHMLNKMLMAFGAPKHRAHTGGEPLPAPQRNGQAFCELLERYPTQQLPKTGGVSARTIVQISHDHLTQRLGAAGVATLDDTTPIPAWVARRLACETGILPAVMGQQSEILDLGRSKRLHTEAQRIVIFHRDHTCRAEGCDWPAWAGHVHHTTPWSQGGNTTVKDGISLCPHHHTRAHDPTYQMTTSKHGRVIFRRT